jgi:hypothetical protein
MTERKPGRLSIFRRTDDGDVDGPWLPADLPASPATKVIAPNSGPWVPAELPPSNAEPPPTHDRKSAEQLKPWVPPDEAPRDLPATVADDAAVPDAPQKRKKKRGKRQSGEIVETVSGNTGGGQTVINIVNQVAAPVPVYVSPWWGCANFTCPRHYGRACWRVWCGWW